MWYTYLLVGLGAAVLAGGATVWFFTRSRRAIALVIVGTITEVEHLGGAIWGLTMHVDEAFAATGSRHQGLSVPIPQSGSTHTFRVPALKLAQADTLKGQRVMLQGRELLYPHRPQAELSIHGVRPLPEGSAQGH